MHVDAERGVVDEDLLLELTEPWARLETELIGEERADTLVGRERVGLATGPVQGGDEQLPQRLLERGRRHRGLEVGDELVGDAQVEAGGEVRPRQPGPQLLEAHPVRRDPLGVACGRDEVVGEPRQRRRTGGGRSAEVTPDQEPCRRDRVAAHGERVDALDVDVQAIALVAPDDDRRVAERPAQPRDLRLHGVAPRVERTGPQVVDQPIGAHGGATLEGQAHEELGALTTRNGDRLPVAPDLERSEHRDLQHSEECTARSEALWVSAKCQRCRGRSPRAHDRSRPHVAPPRGRRPERDRGDRRARARER